jgi:hypothetical protein
MKKKYNKLFMLIDDMITKEAQTIQEWANIKLMFKFLEGHLKMMINKEVKKPTHFKNVAVPPNNGYGKVEKRSHHVKEEVKQDYSSDEEAKTEARSCRSVSKHSDYEEEKYPMKGMEIERQDSMQACPHCSKYITPTDEREDNLLVLECAHYYHKD